MTTLWQDIRYAARMLRKSPGFTAIALITLAIGIGANTIMFSFSDALLQQPRHVKNPEQLAYCTIQPVTSGPVGYFEYLTVRDSGLAFSDLTAQSPAVLGDATLVHGDSAWRVQAIYVSSNYFSFLGVAPVLGRSFLPEEERLGDALVVVLSHRLWQRLGGNPKLVGEFLTVNGIHCQVVGVAPKDFTGVSLVGPDLWLPLGSFAAVSTWFRGRTPPGDARADWGYPVMLNIIGRLKPGVNMRVTQAQLQSLIPRFRAEDPRRWPDGASFSLRPPGRIMADLDNEVGHGESIMFSLVLMAVSTIILVIACLNLANMLIVQGASRHREIAVRLALGGGRLRIIRQLLVESGLLALLGGVLGVLLAVCGMRILNTWFATAADIVLRVLQVGLNVRVLMATLGFCLIATLLFGLRPALRLSKRDIAGEMKASGRSVLGSVHRRRGGLSVAGQIALAVALVFSASLLARSAVETARPDPRFPLDDKLVVRIDPESAGYDKVRSIQACAALADHLASLPEVKALGTSPNLFYGGGGWLSIREYLPGAQDDGPRGPRARYGAKIVAGRDYFAAMGIPLLQGRLFNPLDSAPNAEKVAIIDESLARHLRPDGNALGCLIQWGVPEMGEMIPDIFRVVGIVASMPGVQEREARPQMYTPAGADELSPYFYAHVGDRGTVETLRLRIAEEIRRVDPHIPVLSVKTLAEIRNDNPEVWAARFFARLALAAAGGALFLAALGIYAIKGYLVASRTSEIGIRKAMGATHGNILGMVLREGLVLTVVALLAGLLLGLATARVAASLLYGVSPADPLSILVTVVLLGAASLLAGYLPARRAAKVDPMTALRCE
jgi:putative ABC transport system permease protein